MGGGRTCCPPPPRHRRRHSRSSKERQAARQHAFIRRHRDKTCAKSGSLSCAAVLLVRLAHPHHACSRGKRVGDKCVLPLLLGVLLKIGCDVGGDEAAADNRCAHRPPPPAIVNPFTYLCGPPQPGASRRPSTSAEFRLELRSRRWAAAACSPSTARAATAEARSRASETRRAKEYGLLQPSSRADALPPA